MENIVVSWVALMKDFLPEAATNGATEPQVHRQGPNPQLHQHYWEYDRHLLLSEAENSRQAPKAVALARYLQQNFGRPVDLVFLSISDVIDVITIRQKVERVLATRARPGRVDLFLSPGNSSMQIALFLCYVGGLADRLLQLRPPQYSPGGLVPERVFVDWEQSEVPLSYLLRERLQNRSEAASVLITSTLRQLYRRADKIAQTEVNVFIHGETGTGKEHLAQYIHTQSARRQRRMLTVNCSAFTNEMLPSHLFGHRKGSFTGAVSNRKGIFREANGSTVFLDEIGDISPFMQQALLRVLQNGEIIPVGEDRPTKVDVRIISATNRNLVRACHEGHFRWDLYYRLVVAEMEIPPLRERGRNEISKLLEHFIGFKQQQMQRPRPLNLSASARQFILGYPFPGNIRELENLVESLYADHADETQAITPEMLPARFREIAAENPLRLDDVVRQHILHVYRLHEQQKKPTARALNISLNTLKRKLRDYGID